MNEISKKLTEAYAALHNQGQENIIWLRGVWLDVLFLLSRREGFTIHDLDEEARDRLQDEQLDRTVKRIQEKYDWMEPDLALLFLTAAWGFPISKKEEEEWGAEEVATIRKQFNEYEAFVMGEADGEE